MNTEQEVLSFVRENDVKFIRLAFVDLFGTLKNIAIMPSELPRALRGGISFDASSVKGFCDIDHSELFLRPDPRTLTVLPWRPQTGRVVRMLCDCITPEGSLFPGYSRTILRRMDERALEAGCFFRFGTEYEFYLFEQDDQGHPTMIPQDEAGYMDVFPMDKGENVRREICLTLETMGIQPETSHHETGPGQNEIDFHHAEPLTTADSAVTFKGVVRTIAAQYGLHASFMPKPMAGESGNGLHLNLSIEKGGRNIFAPQEDGTLGEEAQHAVAGILRRIREISLFLNPIPSSYQRLGAYEAPKKINWSYGNRSQLIRIPATTAAETGRMELRSPDPACNPYTAFSLVMAAALEGMAEKLPLQAPLAESGELPDTLEEAIKLAEDSAFLPTVLPQEMLEKYLHEKRLTVERDRQDAEALRKLHWKTI
jgi:glutamine synthetase